MHRFPLLVHQQLLLVLISTGLHPLLHICHPLPKYYQFLIDHAFSLPPTYDSPQNSHMTFLILHFPHLQENPSSINMSWPIREGPHIIQLPIFLYNVISITLHLAQHTPRPLAFLISLEHTRVIQGLYMSCSLCLES